MVWFILDKKYHNVLLSNWWFSHPDITDFIHTDLCLLCVSFFFHRLICSEKIFNESTSSYNLRTNNIFRRIGMPGPAPIPFLGEMFNVIRKVINFVVRYWETQSLKFVLFRECTRTIQNLLKNTAKLSGECKIMSTRQNKLIDSTFFYINRFTLNNCTFLLVFLKEQLP
jgi:hypothetical protein